MNTLIKDLTCAFRGTGLVLLFFWALIAIGTSCKKDKTHNTDSRKMLLTKMTNSNGSFVYEYDQQDRLTSETFYRQSTPRVIDYKETYSEFNAAGLPGKIVITGEASVVSGTVAYDAQNRITKIIFRNTTGAAISSQNFVYSGNTVDLSTRNEQTGFVSSRTVYTFNAQGNIASYEIYSLSGSVVQRVVNKTFDDKKSVKEFYNPTNGVYSVNNETSSETTIVSSGQVYQFAKNMEYNSDGFVTKITSKNVSTGTESIIIYEYIKK